MKKTICLSMIVLLLHTMVGTSQTNTFENISGSSDSQNQTKELKTVFSSVAVYPNPSSGVANFVISQRQNKTLTFCLYDSRLEMMRRMDNITKDEFTFVNDGLKDGIYFYRFTDSNNKVVGTGKLILSSK